MILKWNEKLICTIYHIYPTTLKNFTFILIKKYGGWGQFVFANKEKPMLWNEIHGFLKNGYFATMVYLENLVSISIDMKIFSD
jgi:hypothetical protein